MKTKILIKGPALSYSQYGDLCRDVIQEVRNNKDVDLYILNTGWGNSGWIYDDDEFREFVDSSILKTSSYISEGSPSFEISMQISHPSEWRKLAPNNVGIFNGSDTSISPAHYNAGYEIVDAIVVHSEAQKATIPESYLKKTKIVQRLIKDKIELSKSSIPVETEYNFLCPFKWEPKNNIEQVMTSFFQEFQNEPVGLILNTYIKSRSNVDKAYTVEHLQEMLSIFPKNNNCKIYLLHGAIEREELYSDNKVCCLVDTRHSMEYDSSFYDSLRAGISIVSSRWGDGLDISDSNYFVMDSCIENLKDRHILSEEDKNMQWNYPDHSNLRKKMREAYQSRAGVDRDYSNYESLKDKKLNLHNKMNYNIIIHDINNGEKNETK